MITDSTTGGGRERWGKQRARPRISRHGSSRRWERGTSRNCCLYRGSLQVEIRYSKIWDYYNFAFAVLESTIRSWCVCRTSPSSDASTTWWVLLPAWSRTIIYIRIHLNPKQHIHIHNPDPSYTSAVASHTSEITSISDITFTLQVADTRLPSDSLRQSLFLQTISLESIYSLTSEMRREGKFNSLTSSPPYPPTLPSWSSWSLLW